MKLQPFQIFLIAFFAVWLLLRFNLLSAFIVAYLIYLAFGGWKFQRILYHTFYRDMKGLRCLIMILYMTYRNYYTKEPFADIFSRTVKRVGRNKVAIYFGDQTWTFGQLDDYSNKVANLLLQAGFKKGDKVFLLMHSSAAYIGIWLGATKIGVATALLNYNLRKAPLEHSLTQVDGKGIIVGNSLKDAFLEIDGTSKFPAEHIWYVDEADSCPKSSYATSTESEANWNRQLAEASKAAPPKLPRTSNREHIIYAYTSGTTGLPKAAIITTPRYLHIATGTRYGCGIYTSDVIYLCLPPYHTNGLVCSTGQMLVFGSTLAIRPKFSATQFWNDCIKYHCTSFVYVGEICRYLLAQPRKIVDTQHQVRLAYGNGLRKEAWIEFQKRFNVPRIGEFYAATESNAGIVNFDGKVGAVGVISPLFAKSYPICVIRIDRVTGDIVRNPITGLCIKCEANEPGLMIGRIDNKNPSRFYDGYTNRGDSDKKVLKDVFKRGDMWFSTGDLLYVDEFGYLYFSDRLGDTFRWRGENVSTHEVEAVLLRAFPELMNTVYGVSVPGNEGRAGMAALALNMDKITPDEEAEIVKKLCAAVKDQLPKYARPLFLRLCQSIAETSTFKLLKNDLVKAAFDPNGTKDHLYWLNPASGAYETLTPEIFAKINNGDIRV